MSVDPCTLFRSFWSRALGVASEVIVGGGVSFTSSGLYRERREDAVFLFEHLESGSVIVSAPASMINELEESQAKSWNDLDLFLSRRMILKFDDIDFFLKDKERSFSVAAPYIVGPMSDKYKSRLQLFLESCTEDEVDTLDLADDTLNDHIIVAHCGDEIVGAARYYVIPGTSLLTDLTLLTSSAHRNKGLAKAVLSPLLDEVFRQKLVPRYRVKTDNVSSIKVAESFGFKMFNRIRSYYPTEN